MPNHDDWITTSQAARRIGVSASTIVSYARNGRLEHITLPSGHRRYKAADVDALKAAKTGPEAA